ncbi:MAG: DUF1028 domain-containing protein [Reyranella sp.]|uniref:DUF1028 domain-containing protein n=1 Tax=Reyranella sp. TaxID=1929291 RepID=UPI003D0F2F1F
MTYTILGRCQRTGRLGIGVATFSIAVGLYCNGVQANTGVTISQAFANQRNNRLALRLLEQGFTARSVLQQLVANDPDGEYRQIGIVDRGGNAAAHTGPRTRGWSGHVTGDNHVAFGNGLVGPQVADAIAAGFLAEPGADLEHRLLMAIEAGRDAGGQGTVDRHKPERSAALIVYSQHAYADIDLRVDLHATAVEELRRVWTEYKKYEAYYQERGRNPRSAIGQEVFMARLAAAGT